MDAPGGGDGARAASPGTLRPEVRSDVATLATSKASAQLREELNVGRDVYTAVEPAPVYDWKTEDGKLRAHRSDARVCGVVVVVGWWWWHHSRW